eukprot:gnl/TRDRNA2_/TRDRNA2_91822_c0_seq1.p1 gnl/TRDRNA2_/TRDRNA2_91822_c0~~gnl/TRDRNA2_/TRDRNA2_91822_c0_seq1.p1  ORF type:complete len:119 (+),score=24.96 gnl/TRDRNA2_/TRDRNA2_91822_c0_seq1:137-493(+)
MAQPVTAAAASVGVVDVVDEVVDVELEAELPPPTRKRAAADMLAAPVANDIVAWIRSLDGGSLKSYEKTLVGMFDEVAQISNLYAERLQDFFEDVGVKDPNHRLAFATALRALRPAQR